MVRVTRFLQPRPWTWAVLSVLLILAWQGLTVHANYQGYWSGLFRTGHTTVLPPFLVPTTFRNAHPAGYDGQFYRLLAYDPFLQRDTVAYLDLPLLRSRRILVPLLAWTLAAGHSGFVDAAYILVIAAFVGMGVYCLTKIMMLHGRHPSLGLLFLLIPAVPIAVDSMTIDVALAALTVCFAFQATTGRERGQWWTLAAACLVRETGVLLPAAAVAAALLARAPRKACLWATATFPALGWYGYLYHVLPPAALSEGFVPRWFIPHPKLGILLRTVDPPQYPLLAGNVQLIVRALDSVSLAATIALVVAGILLLRKMRPTALQAAIVLYLALLAAATDKDFWNTPYGYSRPIAPLFVLLLAGVAGFKQKRLLVAVALLLGLLDLRICAEVQKQMTGVLHLLVSG